jgi:hypothetical protein
MRITEWLNLAGNEADAQAVIYVCVVMQAGDDRLAGYANEVKAGRIVHSI